MKTVLLAFALAVLGGLFIHFLRNLVVSHDPAIWHVDPLGASDTGKPHQYRVAPAGSQGIRIDEAAKVYELSPQELANRLSAFIQSEPRVTKVAESDDKLWFTYVQKTRFLRYPDYVSIKVIDLGQGRSTLVVFSRSRFGFNDIGVNHARVTQWLGAIAPYASGEPQ